MDGSFTPDQTSVGTKDITGRDVVGFEASDTQDLTSTAPILPGNGACGPGQ
jgi:hypothetical protein